MSGQIRVGGRLWLSEVQRAMREQVTRFLSCLIRQGQRQRRLIRTESVVPAQAAASRSGV